jgi:two-component system cell cycle sensor histidine kinase/response regulator CckA
MESPMKAPRKTILVAEDTALVLNTVRRILERANFTVLAAVSASEAMQLAECSKTIDLLLSDVVMPDMSGPALALKLKELRPNMQVILMSGYDGGEMHFLDHGWHFIRKPFVPVQLVAEINNVLNGGIRDQGTDHFDTRSKSDLSRHAYMGS